ncbi:MAG: ribonuclease HII [Puniceicoccales bacterium]
MPEKKQPARGHPLWRFDRKKLRECGARSLVGIDEAGRGALAGPVVAAAAFIHSDAYDDPAFRRHSRAINDSKQLTAEARDTQFILIETWRAEGLVTVFPAAASVEEIEARNILGATRLAMERALALLERELCPIGNDDSGLFRGESGQCDFPWLLVDGKPLKPFPWRHEAVVGGDGKSLAIAMASIVAKVTRDQLMVELHAEDRRFGYDQHKGYGAPRHLEAIRAHGATPHHRAKFLRKLVPAPVASQGELF